MGSEWARSAAPGLDHAVFDASDAEPRPNPELQPLMLALVVDGHVAAHETGEVERGARVFGQRQADEWSRGELRRNVQVAAGMNGCKLEPAHGGRPTLAARGHRDAEPFVAGADADPRRQRGVEVEIV